jgi:hypothetical protein
MLLLIPVAFAIDKQSMIISEKDYGKTKVMSNNIAAVKDIDKEIYIDKFEAKSGDTVNLETTGKINRICFEFTVPTSKISIEMDKTNLFWFDTKLDSKANIDKNNICYEGLELNSDNLQYKITYSGEGRIKYNIVFDDTILDPYVVGSLNTSNYLSLYIPFDNNIDARWNSVLSNLNISSMRINNTVDSYLMDGGACVNYANGFDGDYSTYTSPSCYFIVNFTKKVNDTGMILQAKHSTSITGTSGCRGEFTTNYTVPSECINAYSSYVQFRYTITSGYSYGVSYDCYNGVGYVAVGSCMASGASGNADFYDSSIYITNQSNFTSFSQGIVPTSLVNNNSLNAGYLFAVYNNSQDILNQNNGSDKNIIHNTSGSNFNGVDSITNLTNTLSIGDSGNDYSIYIKYNYLPVSTGASEHLAGSGSSSWDKGWQLKLNNNSLNYSCTSESGLVGYTISNLVDNINKEHNVVVVVKNIVVIP